MHRCSAILTSVLLLLLLVSPVQAEPITIKFSHVVDPDTPKGKAAEYFKKLIEQRSNNRIKVEIYPLATLYDDRAALEALKLNAIQLAAPSFSKVSGLLPQLQIFDLPFLFKDFDHLHQVIDSKVGASLLERASSQGLVALSFWDNGFKQLSANRSLAKPDDARGLKFRIMDSRVLEQQFRAIDADPQVLPFSDVYEALAQGLIDGQENTLSNIYTRNFHRVQSHLSISNHGYLGYLLVTNEIFWSQLPDDLKVIMRGTIADATEYAREMAVTFNDDYQEKLRASGQIEIHQLSAAERADWQKQMLKIYPRFYEVIGEDLIEKVLQDRP